MPQLVVLTGPIGAGKSALAAAAGTRLRDAGLSAAVAGLDEVVESLRAPAECWRQSWRQARRAHAALIGGWLRSGVDVILADGSFYEPDEITTVLSEAPAGTVTRWYWLDVS